MMLWSVIPFERLRDRGAIGALFFALLLLLTTPVTSAAAESSSPAAPVSEQTGEAPRPAVVKGNAHLRAAPSMDGTILAIAKEGTVVQILEEASRWYRVKTEDGTEAWIYKNLVLVLQIPLGSLSSRATQPDAPAPAQSSETSAERQPPPAPEPPAPSATPPPEPERLPSAPVPQPAPVSEPVAPVLVRQDPPQPVEPSGSPGMSPYALFQGVNAYLTGALLLVLLVTIALNLRTSRQLKRAMREGLQESSPRLVSVRAARRIKQRTYESAQVTRQPTPERRVTAGAPTLPQPPTATAIADPTTDLSPLEQAVVDVISAHGELREGDLMQRLEQEGLHGVLVKGVIGEIVRKTGSDGPPWVHVRYAQGGYTYRLQPRDIPALTRGSERG